jgi:heme-degrading monooxygenase HmoA
MMHMIDPKTKWISILAFTVAREALREIGRQASDIMARKGPLLNGFIEGIVMADETQTQLLIVTQWESQAAWSSHQWDEEISETLGSLVETSTAFEFHGYEPITIVRPTAT